jgi:alkylated DNA repair dioxygenase AlkB
MSMPEGLSYHPNLIGPEYQDILWRFIHLNMDAWTDGPGGRKVHQYGSRYDYITKTIMKDVDPIPRQLSMLSQQLVNGKFLEALPEQCIINAYEPGQGITPHTDHVKLFGEEVATVSLGSSAVMVFSKDKESFELYLEPGSLAVLRGDARWKWTHSIPARLSDHGIRRDRRVSITFRTLKNG